MNTKFRNRHRINTTSYTKETTPTKMVQPAAALALETFVILVILPASSSATDEAMNIIKMRT